MTDTIMIKGGVKGIFSSLLLFFSLSTSMWGQAYRAYYDFIETNAYDGTVGRDLFVLDIKDNQSLFQSYNRQKRDSIMESVVKAGGSPYNAVRMGRSLPPGSYMKVFYDAQENRYTLSDFGGIFFFYYHESVKGGRRWTFGAETKEVSGYPSHSARIRLYGRDWTAYYTEDIPIAMGPWKLAGLPGLITEAYTVDSLYQFRLTGFEVMGSADVKLHLNKQSREISRKEMIWIKKHADTMDTDAVESRYAPNIIKSLDKEKLESLKPRQMQLRKRFQYIEKE